MIRRVFAASTEESLLTNRARLSKGRHKEQAVETLCCILVSIKFKYLKLCLFNKKGRPKATFHNSISLGLKFNVQTEEEEPTSVIDTWEGVVVTVDRRT
jgi:hypothetical protein